MNPLAIAFAITALTGSSLAQTGQAGLDNGQNAAPPAPPPYHHWNRGQTLPEAYRVSPIVDYARHHLRQPPYGYQWYLCGDQMVLAAVDSGLIFEVIEGD